MPKELFLCHGHCKKHRMSQSVFKAANNNRCRENAICVDSRVLNEPDKVCDLKEAPSCFQQDSQNIFCAIYLMACPYSVYITRLGPRVSFWKTMTRILKPGGEIFCLLHERSFKPYGHPYRTPKNDVTSQKWRPNYSHFKAYRNQFASHIEQISGGHLRFRKPLSSEFELAGLEHIAVVFRKCE